MSSPNGTQAVDRAARLLTEVVHAPGSVTFTELAAATTRDYGQVKADA